MPDHADTTAQHRRAIEVVRMVRDRLRELGISDEQLRQVVPQTDDRRRAYVRLGVLPLADAEKILKALAGDRVS